MELLTQVTQLTKTCLSGDNDKWSSLDTYVYIAT